MNALQYYLIMGISGALLGFAIIEVVALNFFNATVNFIWSALFYFVAEFKRLKTALEKI